MSRGNLGATKIIDTMPVGSSPRFVRYYVSETNPFCPQRAQRKNLSAKIGASFSFWKHRWVLLYFQTRSQSNWETCWTSRSLRLVLNSRNAFSFLLFLSICIFSLGLSHFQWYLPLQWAPSVYVRLKISVCKFLSHNAQTDFLLS